MSYYGASGTKRVYVATDQPLYGLGEDPTPVSAATPLKSVTTSQELMGPSSGGQGTLLQAIEASLGSQYLASLGVLCLGVKSKSDEYDSVPVIQLFKLWQSEGKFVVLRRAGFSMCQSWKPHTVPSTSDPNVMGWTAYAYPVDNIGSIANDPDAYVWGLPYGDMDWSKYVKYIPASAGGTSTKTPEPPKVVTSPPKVDPTTGEVKASMSWPSWGTWAAGAVLAYLGWTWWSERQYQSNVDEEDDFGYLGTTMPPRRYKKSNPIDGILEKGAEMLKNFAAGEADDYVSAFKGALAPWLKAFALNAAPRIKAAVSQGLLCEAHNEQNGRRYPCSHSSAVQCAACGRKTCMYHSFVTWKGDAICWHCASHTVMQMSMGGAPPAWNNPRGHDVPPRSHAPGPRDEDVDKALAILGLTRAATWEQVNDAFRSYVRRNHPDRVPESDRAVAQEQFKQVNAAFNLLKDMGWGQRAA